MKKEFILKKYGLFLFIIGFVFSQPINDIQTNSYSENNEGKVVSQQTSNIGRVGNVLTAVGGFLLASTFIDVEEVKPEDLEDVLDGLRIRGQAGSVLIGVGQTLVFLGSSNSEGESTFRKVRKALFGF